VAASGGPLCRARRVEVMRKIPRKDAPQEFLELFFPIHYTVGMTVEDTLRNNVLTRQQTIILWLIRARGIDGKLMSRKDIVKAMSYWFELTSSAISKALRSLARPPLGLITITEDPRSGREKIIALTPKGERFLLQMVENGCALIKRLTDAMTDQEINQGIHIFKRISEVFDSEVEQKRADPKSTLIKPSVKRKK
jgi:DNA-binding MarR family transcriptional regulator